MRNSLPRNDEEVLQNRRSTRGHSELQQNQRRDNDALEGLVDDFLLSSSSGSSSGGDSQDSDGSDRDSPRYRGLDEREAGKERESWRSGENLDDDSPYN